jgi:hypothetical protein
MSVQRLLALAIPIAYLLVTTAVPRKPWKTQVFGAAMEP